MNQNRTTTKKTEQRQTTRMQAPLGERQIVTELSEDFDLPDYRPEIKRLLRVQAKVSPADTYIGAGNAECSGTVEYAILYSGADGALYCATQTGEYRFAFPVELPADFDAGEGLICDVDSRPENVSGRVMAPRKLTLRCRLRSRAQLFGTRVFPDPVGQAAGMQRLSGECDSARLFLGNSEPFELGDEILCDPREGDVRVISADGQVFITEATAGSGTVTCRGEVCLKLLCSHDATGEIYTVQRRIPFSQTVPTDGMEVNCEACATGDCRDLRVTVEDGKIGCDVTVSLSVRAQRNEAVSLIRDAYSTEAECVTNVQEITVPTALGCVCGNFSVNHTEAREEAGIPAGARIVDADGTVTLGDVETERGKCRIGGKCRFRLILATEDDYTVQEVEVPVRYETDGGAEAVTASELSAEVIGCRARIDGEKLALDAEIAISGTLRGERVASVLTEAAVGAAWQAPGAVFTVCYPAKDDTLWSVAKRYHVPVADLCTKNALAQAPAADSADSLTGVKYLMV